jgi:hypothetical protein
VKKQSQISKVKDVTLFPPYVLEVVAEPPLSAFGFSNESFEFDRVGPEQQALFFFDASGHYRLSLKDVLSHDGNINRKAPVRLVRLSA